MTNIKINKIVICVLFLQLIGAMYYLYHLLKNGYLPSPFIYNKNDTFMDFYNSLFWAENEGRYTEWKSVYPPFNFLILKIFSLFILDDHCYLSPKYLRGCSEYLIFGFILIYLIAPFCFLNNYFWKKLSKLKLIIIYLIFVISTPMLYTLERGNLIILCLIFLPLVLTRSQILRIIGISVLINIKPYFILLCLVPFFKKNFIELFLCLFLTLSLFVITGLILDVNFIKIFENITEFSNKDRNGPVTTV